MTYFKEYWPHAPEHRLSEGGTFIVTAGTYCKLPHFRNPERLDVLERGLLKVAAEFEWRLEAWAVFSNHYHFVGHTTEAENLSRMLGVLHAKLADWVNRLDGTPGRRVWHNFWETRLTHERSYLARLNYVHQNAVKHGLVDVATQYRWCSAAWFEQTASRAQVRSVYRFRTNRIHMLDDFDVETER
ncbi:MAG: transposase [Blastocatellia bacterium]|nr:transposase [Blastocatellia bacterium]MBK6427671.1 transposase [Blastocatellia bacterium]